jgi:hypothetical protein
LKTFFLYLEILAVSDNKNKVWKYMERIFKKAKNYKEAQEWDVEQNLRMTPEQRQDVSKELRERVYGKETVDIRDSVRCK